MRDVGGLTPTQSLRKQFIMSIGLHRVTLLAWKPDHRHRYCKRRICVLSDEVPGDTSYSWANCSVDDGALADVRQSTVCACLVPSGPRPSPFHSHPFPVLTPLPNLCSNPSPVTHTPAPPRPSTPTPTPNPHPHPIPHPLLYPTSYPPHPTAQPVLQRRNAPQTLCSPTCEPRDFLPGCAQFNASPPGPAPPTIPRAEARLSLRFTPSHPGPPLSFSSPRRQLLHRAENNNIVGSCC